MSTASEIIELLKTHNSAVTLYGGYAVNGRGERVMFEAGTILKQTQNKGRCTSMLMQYKDGSIIKFNWSPTLGGRFKEYKK